MMRFNHWCRHRDLHRPAGLKLVYTVPGPVIPLETLRAQCEVMAIDMDSDGNVSSPDDLLLIAYLDAAVDYAEELTGLTIAQRTYEMSLDRFPEYYLELLRPPIIELQSFTYADDTDGHVPEEDYGLDDFAFPPRLYPLSSWPIASNTPNTIKLLYRAGYSNEVNVDSDAQSLPASIKQALLLLTAHFFRNREDTVDKVLATIPNGFQDLLRPKTIRLGFA